MSGPSPPFALLLVLAAAPPRYQFRFCVHAERTFCCSSGQRRVKTNSNLRSPNFMWQKVPDQREEEEREVGSRHNGDRGWLHRGGCFSASALLHPWDFFLTSKVRNGAKRHTLSLKSFHSTFAPRLYAFCSPLTRCRTAFVAFIRHITMDSRKRWIGLASSFSTKSNRIPMLSGWILCVHKILALIPSSLQSLIVSGTFPICIAFSGWNRKSHDG